MRTVIFVMPSVTRTVTAADALARSGLAEPAQAQCAAQSRHHRPLGSALEAVDLVSTNLVHLHQSGLVHWVYVSVARLDQ